MEQIKPFKYQENYISFSTGDKLMVNATDMAKAFGKSPWKWLELPSTKEFIEALSENRSLAVDQLVTSIRGGNVPSSRGNWFHEDVAMEFARWLNPAFAIWCNDRIKELLRYGATAVNPEDLLNPDYVIKVMTALKQERHAREIAEMKAELQAKELKAAAPKIEYHDTVLQSEGLISVTEMANELGFPSAKALNKFLKEQGIIRKVNDTWAMRAEYSGHGYAKYKTHPYTDSKGQTQTAHHLYFTELGRSMLQTYSRLKKTA